MSNTSDSNTTIATPTSFWPLHLRRFWLTASEFPLTTFALLVTSIGLLSTLRYFSAIKYPIPEINLLLAPAGLVTAVAALLTLTLATLLWMPLIALQMIGGFRPRWNIIALAQIVPATLFMEWAFLSADWDDVGAPWNWGIVIFTFFGLLRLASLIPWARVKATPWNEIFKYAGILLSLSSLILMGWIDGFNYLIHAIAGASRFTANERAVIFSIFFTVAVLSIAGLSTIEPRKAFLSVLCAVIILLFFGSIVTAELPKILANAAGIRIKGVSELIVSKETCVRIQRMAKAQQIDWKGSQCAESGAFLRAQVQVHSAGRWLLQPYAMDGIEMPSTMSRITVPEAAVELVLPSQEKPTL